MNNKILTPDYLAKERAKMQTNWIKKAWYSFIKNIFRQKTTFEKYALLMAVLQIVSIFCSYVSYVTGRAFIETYLGAWVKDPNTVFWAAVACIGLLELVKMLSSLPLFLSVVRLSGIHWGALILLGCTFGFSMYISYEGAEDRVLLSAAPTLINTGEISTYYDSQIKALTIEKKEYNTNPKYQTSKGVVFHKVLDGHIKPLTTEINRLTALRDQKIIKAETKNGAIQLESKEATTADAQTMAFIALGADGVKLVVSLLFAWFLVASAKDYEIINDEGEKEADKFGASAFGLLEAMPPTEAAQKQEGTQTPTAAPITKSMQFDIKPDPNKPKNGLGFIEFSKVPTTPTGPQSLPVVIVRGLNKGQGMTKPQTRKMYNKYKSRLRSIEKGSTKEGTAETAKANISKLEKALKSFDSE
jgi:hypothetical protein